MNPRIFLLAALLALPAGAADWTYDGDGDSEDDWASLSPEYAPCQGTQQSPVSINYTETADLPKLAFDYRPVAMAVRYDGHGIVADVQPGSVLKADGETWQLENIFLHSPGEHTVRDDYHLAEIHLLHRNSSGRVLMVAVFADTGAPNPVLSAILDKVPTQKEHAPGQATADPSALLPKELGYYAYTGSLTMPPCTENIEWRVLKTPAIIGAVDLSRIGRISGRNARMIQPAYMRVIRESR